MHVTKAQRVRLLGVAIGVSAVLIGWPCATSAQAPLLNEAWATRMTSLLKLSSSQQSALRNFITTSAKAAKVIGPSEEQLGAMPLREKFDYWSEHIAQLLVGARADAASLHRFYASLSAEQQRLFDDATKPNQRQRSVAADVVTSPAADVPDYKLPAHTNADWLIKPTSENISRVYPSAAARDQLSGKVLLGCTVDEDGYLGDCVVLNESPKDQGFGNAALEMTAYMRMQAATNYGVPVRSTVRFPVSFTPEDTK